MNLNLWSHLWKNCTVFFSVLHYIQITKLQITPLILGVLNSFFGAFSFWEAGGKGARCHPALHLYFGPKM